MRFVVLVSAGRPWPEVGNFDAGLNPILSVIDRIVGIVDVRILS